MTYLFLSINNEDDMEDQAASKDKDEEMEPMSPSSEVEPTKPSIPNNYLQHRKFTISISVSKFNFHTSVPFFFLSLSFHLLNILIISFYI